MVNRVIGRVMVAGGALAVCAAIGELALRVVNPLQLDWRMVQGHPTRIVALAPNFDGRFNGARVRTNRFGHRVPTRWDKRYELEKPEGMRRILVLGDSFAFGDEWPDESSIAEQLQGLLDPSAASIQVLNLGVPTYHPCQELSYLQESLPQLSPDLVILQFADANDLLPAESPIRADAVTRARWWLRRHSYLYWIVADVWYHGAASAPGKAMRHWRAALMTGAQRDAAAKRGNEQLPERLRRAAHAYYEERRQAIEGGSLGWKQSLGCYRDAAALLAAQKIPLVIIVATPNWDLLCADWRCRGTTIRYSEAAAPGAAFYRLLAHDLGAFTRDYLSLEELFGAQTLEALFDGDTWHYGPRKTGIIAERLGRIVAQMWIPASE